MFGNILNNSQILRLMKDQNQIQIVPFDENRLKLAHYALSPAGIIEPQKLQKSGHYSKPPIRHFDENNEYLFEANEYAVVEVDQMILLKDGLVGHFIPSSTFIDGGFALTAGKLDPGYGALGGQRQSVRFGVKNLLNESNTLYGDEPIAHVYFIDMRGLNSNPFGFSEVQEQRFVNERSARFKRARDDGPDYGDGS
ncbi:MAG: hypothetical protein NXH87_17200 [Rhodobiaceae bacterium]|nr:hypothetical protein [Rhodobiaceae bacterium]